jgi:hypothetical protein
MEFTQKAFHYFDNTTKNLTDELLDWKSCPEANTVRNILGHLFVEWYGVLPKLLSGITVDEEISVLKERAHKCGYVGIDGKSLADVRIQLDKGKQYIIDEFGNLSDDDLLREIDWFIGKEPVGGYLLVFIKEICHHEGQIAAIIGLNKRMKEKSKLILW